MANEQNLKPSEYKFTQEDAKKGQIASAKKRREAKQLKEILEMALSTKTETGNKYIDIAMGLINSAEKGNPKAFEVIRDTLGQKPIEQVQNINPPIITIERPK